MKYIQLLILMLIQYELSLQQQHLSLMGYCLLFGFIYRAFVMLLSKQSQGYKASVILFFFYKKGVMDFLVFGLPG